MTIREKLETRKTIFLKEPIVKRIGSSNPDVTKSPIGWLKSTLEDAIKDEELAASKYQILADQLYKAGYTGFSSGVTLIASDEREHKRTLENILYILRGIS